MTAPDPVAALREEVAGVLAEQAMRRDYGDDPERIEVIAQRWGRSPAAWREMYRARAYEDADALLAHLAPLVEARERVEALADEFVARADEAAERDDRNAYARRVVWDRAASQLRAANALTPTEEQTRCST